jgi:hypothetical protein
MLGNNCLQPFVGRDGKSLQEISKNFSAAGFLRLNDATAHPFSQRTCALLRDKSDAQVLQLDVGSPLNRIEAN